MAEKSPEIALSQLARNRKLPWRRRRKIKRKSRVRVRVRVRVLKTDAINSLAHEPRRKPHRHCFSLQESFPRERARFSLLDYRLKRKSQLSFDTRQHSNNHPINLFSFFFFAKTPDKSLMLIDLFEPFFFRGMFPREKRRTIIIIYFRPERLLYWRNNL